MTDPTSPAPLHVPDPVPETADLRMGAALRRLRHERSWSLQTVADRAGISVGHLSQLERGLTSGTLRDLMRIAVTLGTDLASLLAREADEGGPSHPHIVRAGRRQQVGFADGVAKEVLTPSLDGTLRMYMVRLDPHGSSGPETYTHAGDEAGLVLAGRLVLNVGGVDHLLQDGDSFGFPSGTPHRFLNPSAEPALVVWVNAGPPPRDSPA